MKNLFKSAVNAGWNLAVGALGAAIGNSLYEVGSYIIHETILKDNNEKVVEE